MPARSKELDPKNWTHGDPMGTPWGTHGSPWAPMGTHGVPWGPMGSHGDPREPMGTHGNPWKPMGTHGDPCEPMGTHGNPWGPMGTHGNPWGPMGTHANPWGPSWPGSLGRALLGDPRPRHHSQVMVCSLLGKSSWQFYGPKRVPTEPKS